MSKMFPPNWAGLDQRQRAGNWMAHIWLTTTNTARGKSNARLRLSPLKRGNAKALLGPAGDTTNGPSLSHRSLRIELHFLTAKSVPRQAQREDCPLRRAALEFQESFQVVGQLLADRQSDAMPAALGRAAGSKQPGLECRRHPGPFVVDLEVDRASRRKNHQSHRPAAGRGL